MLTDPSDFVGPLLLVITIVIVLGWYIVFVQRRRHSRLEHRHHAAPDQEGATSHNGDVERRLEGER